MEGRRAGSRNEEVNPMPEGTNPSSERVEAQPEGPHLEIVEQQNENPHLRMERTKSELTMQEKATKTSSKKRPKCYDAPVRRSLRIQDVTTASENLIIEPVIEDITVSKSESEDEQPAHKMHGSTSGEKSMEEKVDYLIQLVETMNSKARNRSPVFCESPDSTYKSLYAYSQKIEALTNENHQLSLKLKVALAKLEAYESGTRAYSKTPVNLSSQTAGGALAPPDELLSHFLNRKRSSVKAPQAAAKRKKQGRKASGRFS